MIAPGFYHPHLEPSQCVLCPHTEVGQEVRLEENAGNTEIVTTASIILDLGLVGNVFSAVSIKPESMQAKINRQPRS